MSKKKSSVGSSGFGVIDVLFSMTITSILVVTTMSNTATQYKKLKSYGQKLDVQQLQSLLKWRLSKADVCRYNFSSVYVNTVNPGDTRFNMSRIKYADFNSPDLVVSGTKVPSAMNNLIVKSIQFNNVTSSGTNYYSGKMEIAFDNVKLAMPLASIFIPISVITDSTGRVIDCSIPGTSSFQGMLVQTTSTYSIANYSSTSDIDVSTLNQDYSLFMIKGSCACWDNDPNKWANITVQFLDSSGSNTGLYNSTLCYTNSSNSLINEDFGQANYDTNTMTFPKMGTNSTVKTIRLIFGRSTTSCRSDAYIETYK